MPALGYLGFFSVLILGLSQFAMGFAGLYIQFGVVWAGLAVVASLFFRISLPLTVGVFFCAWKIWHWPIIGALALALPGLALMIPGLIAAAISTISGKRN